MSELRGRGRPRSVGAYRCDRCAGMVAKIRVRWPDGNICGPCFTAAANTYGTCAHCQSERLLVGRSAHAEAICRDCAGITTNFSCAQCGREAERLRAGHCAQCIVVEDLTAILKPNDPPDLRLHRLIRELATTDRTRSIISWTRLPTARPLLVALGDRTLKLSHEAFDELPPSTAVEHLREMLIHHRILPHRGNPHLVRFESWLDARLTTFEDRPHIQHPLEQFGRWHHLRRLRADPPPANMDYATRTAKQEITEAGKFLLWLDTDHNAQVDELRQEHIDLYWSEGPTTRKHIRNFLQQRGLTGRSRTLVARARVAKTTPLSTTEKRLASIRLVLASENVHAGTRVAALIFLLYGCPVGKLVALRADCIESSVDGMTIRLGTQPAPIPMPVLPLFSDYLENGARTRSMNKNSPWLFPSSTPGSHIHASTLWNRLKIFDIAPLATRNSALFDLTQELDATSLAALLGYDAKTMVLHSQRAGNAMASYPASRSGGHDD